VTKAGCHGARRSERIPRVQIRVHKHGVHLERVDAAAVVERGHAGRGAVRNLILRRIARVAHVGGRLEGDVLGVERGVGLAEHVVALLGVVEQLLEVLYPLVLALSVRPLRGAVLGPPSLREEGLLIQGFPRRFSEAWKFHTYRQDCWRRVLVAVFPLSLGGWLLLVCRVCGFAVFVPGTRVSARETAVSC